MNIDKRALSHQRKQIFKCKSVLKKRKCGQSAHISRHEWILFLMCLTLPYLSKCQYSTHDPRWYSREGDFNYQWPNPGDPEYRYIFFHFYSFRNARCQLVIWCANSIKITKAKIQTNVLCKNINNETSLVGRLQTASMQI